MLVQLRVLVRVEQQLQDGGACQPGRGHILGQPLRFLYVEQHLDRLVQLALRDAMAASTGRYYAR